jgi:hypothetical protein
MRRRAAALLIATLTAGALVVGMVGHAGASVDGGKKEKKPLCKGKTKAAAEEAIEEAFDYFLNGMEHPDVEEKQAYIQYMGEPEGVSTSLVSFIVSNSEKLAASAATTSVQVNEIRCKGKDEVTGEKFGKKLAYVQYDLVLNGTPAPGIASPGAAILLGNTWKVTTKTFCDLSQGGDPTVYETVQACLDILTGDEPSDLE